MTAFHNFSRSTGLNVNSAKCKGYIGAVDDKTRDGIVKLTSFKEETPPFKYLGVPLTGKKLTIQQYSPLIDKIMSIITHWSARLLIHARRVHLIKSVMVDITTYRMKCFPLPKKMTHKIDSICKVFVWTCSNAKIIKSLIAWKNVCTPKSKCGTYIVSLEGWNNVNMIKLLWNLSGKADNLWIRWVHIYYLKKDQLMIVKIRENCSWIFRYILKQRDKVRNLNS